MLFAPLDLMMKRVDRNSNPDSLLFNELLYAGELIVKATTAAFVAAIEDDREGYRYSLLHALVRADGIGAWASKLEEAIAGPASQNLARDMFNARRVFTERVGKDSWQHKAVYSLQDVLTEINPAVQAIGDRVSLTAWFTKFAEVRNKTRGHGAPTPAIYAKLVVKLNESVRLLIDNNPIFELPWAYLHRNFSGKYNVVPLGGNYSQFADLTQASAAHGANYPDGVYVFAGRPRRVELIYSDADASDFFLPNGSFNGNTYEVHSLITDSRQTSDASLYKLPAKDRPPSETEGRGELDVLGNVFTNIPAVPTGYIRRPRLEAIVKDALTNDRHPVVTLVGRGGIGKTSLALTVLHELAGADRYDLIVWFSARDIDLSTTGPKIVRPKVLAERDVTEEYISLISPLCNIQKDKKCVDSIMAIHMRGSPLGRTLFVFDNFETVRSPIDLFQWIDINIRLPNKAVITSRFREFKADFPIEVSGMERDEINALISQMGVTLKIMDLVGTRQREQIIEESNGHPYVIKIILGEVANTGTFEKPSNMMVRKDEILDALFDRTYANLSPMAARIFMMLSGWRSLVPQLAVEAVLLMHGSEHGTPEKAIDELIRMSLVERTRAHDNSDFLGVPLTAALFGTKKREVSPNRELIENDLRFLQEIGATSATGLKDGIHPRVLALFKKMAKRISERSASLITLQPVLEFVARGYSPAWLLLADLWQEIEGKAGLEKSADCVRRFLEEKPTEVEARAAWQKLITIYRATKNVAGSCSAFLRAAEISEPSLHQISSMANWLNGEREVIEQMDVAERGALFKPLARLMEKHSDVATATDLSRLAWLYLHAGDSQHALVVAKLGLEREPENLFCERLVNKLNDSA